MKIETAQFGDIEIDERQKLSVSHIIGFEEYKKYALLDGDPPFYWLQSLEEKDFSFVLIDPCVFHPDYSPTFAKTEIKELGLKSVHDALVLSIVTVIGPEKLTANLLAPLVINPNNHQGAQLIVQEDNRWFTKHDIFTEFFDLHKKEMIC